MRYKRDDGNTRGGAVVCESSAHTSGEPARPRFMRLSDRAGTARISRKADKIRRTKQEGPLDPS